MSADSRIPGSPEWPKRRDLHARATMRTFSFQFTPQSPFYDGLCDLPTPAAQAIRKAMDTEEPYYRELAIADCVRRAKES